MLARRKRKPEDDEPLVPHGLIGQALEESAPKDAEPEADSIPDAAIPPKMPPRAEDAPRKDQSRRHTAERYRNGLFIVRRNAGALLKTRSAQLSSGILYYVRQHVRASSTELSSRLRIQLQSLRTRLQSTSGSLRTSAALGRARVSNLSGIFLTRIKSTSLPRIKSVSLPHITLPKSPPVFRRRTETDLQTPAPRPRLRVKLRGLPLQARIMLMRLRSEWSLQTEPIAKNSRLWTPLALGAVAALIVISLFSATIHYGKAALPSQNGAVVSPEPLHSSPKAPKPTATMTPTKLVEASAKAAVPNVTHHPQTQKSAPTKPARLKVSVKPKPRHNEDEDYVATDTYVYYGQSSRR